MYGKYLLWCCRTLVLLKSSPVIWRGMRKPVFWGYLHPCMLFDIAIFDNSATPPGFSNAGPIFVPDIVGLPKKNGCVIKRIDKKLWSAGFKKQLYKNTLNFKKYEWPRKSFIFPVPLPWLSYLCLLPHSALVVFARVCLAGGARPHEKEMQVPRDVRQLPAEDLLAGHAGVPAGGVDSQRALPHRHAHQGSQPEHRTAGPLAPQQP